MSLLRMTAMLAAVATLTACLPAPPPEPEPPEPVALGPAPKSFSTTKPYKNKSGAGVPVYSGPDAGAPQVATLDAGDGGLVKTCNEAETRCQIMIGEFGAMGWVDMKAMSL